MRSDPWWNGAVIFAGSLCLFLSAVAALSGQAVTPPSPPQVPAGPGHDTFVRVCSGCHLVTMVTAQRKSADDWTTTVIEMRNRGANASDEELESIIQYLVTNFGPVAPASRVNVNAASASDIAGVLALTPAEGDAIVLYRSKNGKFKDLAALEQVPGIDTAKVEAAKARIDF